MIIDNLGSVSMSVYGYFEHTSFTPLSELILFYFVSNVKTNFKFISKRHDSPGPGKLILTTQNNYIKAE